MDILYAPWRMSYVTDKHKGKQKNKISSADCIFCTIIHEKKDTKNFVLRRFKNSIIMLNKFPYNAGHLMILPRAHVVQLDELSPMVRHELIDVATHSCTVLEKKLSCHGINVGLNLGKASGAGIPGHVHIHILPRWEGDTNWLPLLAQTKQISVDLNQIYTTLQPLFANMKYPAP